MARRFGGRETANFGNVGNDMALHTLAWKEKTRTTSTIAFRLWAIFALTTFCVFQAVAQDISQSEYETGLEWREDNVEDSFLDLQNAQTDLQNKEASLREKEAELKMAEAAFREAESSGDLEAISDAWLNLSLIFVDLKFLRSNHELAKENSEAAEDAWEKNSIWLEQYKNDFEAQSNP